MTTETDRVECNQNIDTFGVQLQKMMYEDIDRKKHLPTIAYLVQPAANRAPSNRRIPPKMAEGIDTPGAVLMESDASDEKAPPATAAST
jgi:hypothetical protein